MEPLPILSGKELVRILGKVGYREVRQRGSHIRLSCPGRKPVTVPNYKSIDRSLLRKILRDARLPLAEFQKWAR
ncbi:MAG: type II toxin-antitoxin system HicA family toxin [Acidobacteria bacterium]|nr:type II toxin-antitoxin system HicA family toxin [Acidobacteriota bacterium]MCH8268955.1 type II toxin-antitoxin system HicA family toxin [Acidobacteriota bacterium]MCZ6491055.1 type II toxin-antitoxin system HicA family toxin [Acidobacteriota bacterium]MCZ6750704.1 type II toxin-antitoxin system HicA family toxin [Acidobacteriota bacterium]